MFLFMLRSIFMKIKGATPQPPMPAGWLPVIGHLHLLSSKSQVLKETFSCWHEEYGPVLMLQLGLCLVLLVSSWEMAKECFTTNDLAFSNRPLSTAAKYMADDAFVFAFSPYGDHWREMRKTAVEEMLSNRRLRSFTDLRTSEINAQVIEAYRLWLANDQQPVKVDMRQLLEELTFNVVARTVVFDELLEELFLKHTMMIGGDDTTASTMIRTIYLLLLHPNALKKVHEELDHHVGKERIVNESDLKNLVYLQAAVKESLRLSPTTPLLALRESKEDCQVGGFCVPAGTRLMVNLWKIHHDLHVWTDPDEFQPEQFLGSNVDVHGKHLQVLPFGSGWRICPGISFALSIVHIALARLLQGFDMKLLPADSFFDDDNPLGFGTILNVLLAPRLPKALYC
ncbi:Protopine 6-monooxygenase [Nymphaea thermarum]|nr:Protopine 6-monooxygenase [Nymphaea thermarum]